MRRLLASAAFACLGAISASAQQTDAEVEAQGAKGDATEIVQELVEDTHEDEAGRIQPSSGAAKPVENWMACRDIDGANQDCQPEQRTEPQG